MYVYHALHGRRFDLRAFVALLNVERRWSLFQTAKVTVNCGYAKPSDFVSAAQPRLFTQKSSVFSYIVLKAAALYDIDKGVALMQRLPTTASVAMLHDAALSPAFWRDVDASQDLDGCRQGDFTIRTLRMSAISID
jgi:hypothetical protein